MTTATTSRSRLEFDPAKHRYTLGGEEIPGTTKILDSIYKADLEAYKRRQLIARIEQGMVELITGTDQWVDVAPGLHTAILAAAKAELEAENAAAEAGTRVHEAIAGAIQNEGYDLSHLSEVERLQTIKACKWLGSTRLSQWEIEQPVYMTGDFGGFAGTPDLVGVLPSGERVIVDWKTGKGKIWKSYYLQNVAYRKAWNWMNRQRGDITPVTKGMIVKLPQTEEGEVEVAEVGREHDDLFLVFLACLRVYQWGQT